MRFLVDNQLPVALARWLAGQGHDCQHVLDLGLNDADDSVIWGRAVQEQRVVVTKDEDFFNRVARDPQKVRLVWVRLGNCRNRALLDAFENLLPRILSELNSGANVVEVR